MKREITLLSEEQVFGSQKLDVIKTVGTKCAVTDFAILLGASVSDIFYVDDDESSKGRTTWWYSSSSNGDGNVRCVSTYGSPGWDEAGSRNCGIRPVLPYADIPGVLKKAKRNNRGILEVEYGEYPQYAPGFDIQRTLADEFSKGTLRKTGKTYTRNSRRYDDLYESFSPVEHEEFEYNGKKYVRVIENCYSVDDKLSNGFDAKSGCVSWVGVSPIVWYVDERSKLLISKNLLASGVRFCNNRQYDGDFENTEMYMFLNEYFDKNMMPSTTYEIIEDDIEKKNRETNPYGLDFREVNEEEIIRGMVEADIPVFLHGLSGDGKSSRVKQIDSESEEVHLGSITMDM
ncbi:MAG: hypothetical protein IKD77_03000, partial [Bacilli bacterium]|nr:hypothetical protein [Bacilli bacterium]